MMVIENKTIAHVVAIATTLFNTKQMKHSKSFLLVLLLTIISSCVSADNLTSATNVKIRGSIQYKLKTIPDSVVLSINEIDGNPWGNLKHVYSKVNDQHHFEISLRNITKPTFVWFSFKGLYTVRKFYVQPGDNINIEIFDQNDIDENTKEYDLCTYTGKGSAKYTLMEKLLRVRNDWGNDFQYRTISSKLYTVSDSSLLNSTLVEYLSIIKKWSKKSTAILNEVSEIKPEIKKIIVYEFDNIRSFALSGIVHNYIRKPSNRKQIRQFYLNNKSFFKPNPPSIYSERMLSGFFSVQNELLLSKGDSVLSLKNNYDELKNRFSGILLDKSISELFMVASALKVVGKYEPSMYDSLLNDAIINVKSPINRQLLVEKLRYRKGSKIVSGQFTDVSGKKFDLESLKGKVVLIDIWYTGCSNCALFHSVYESKIKAMFAGRKDYAYISLNADRRHEEWTNSIQTNRYTTAAELNLNSDLMGFQHPFFKYYNIYGGPFFILIDKNGLLYRRMQAGEFTTPENFISILNNAVNDN